MAPRKRPPDGELLHIIEPLRPLAVRLDTLTPDPENARQHGPQDLAVLRASLSELGQHRPLVVQREGDRLTIRVGNGTFEAARQLGWTWIAAAVVEEDRVRAIRRALVDNRTGELSTWGVDQLQVLLQELGDANAGLGADLGFDDGLMVSLLGGAEAPPIGTDPPDPPRPKSEDGPDPRIERAAELLEKWGVRTGDLWVAGRHRIVCGDARDPAVVRRALGHDEVPPLVVSDPPYCSGGFQEAGKAAGSWGEIAADNLSTRGYQALMREALAAARAQAVYLFCDWRMWIPLYDVVEGSGLAVRAKITWDKGTPGLGALWRTQSEEIMYGARGGVRRIKGRPAKGNVLRCQRTGNRHHYTEKPVELIRQLLEGDAASDRGACPVLDLFAGSGPTLIAAELENRPAAGVELEPAIVAVTLERLAEMDLHPTRAT